MGKGNSVVFGFIFVVQWKIICAQMSSYLKYGYRQYMLEIWFFSLWMKLWHYCPNLYIPVWNDIVALQEISSQYNVTIIAGILSHWGSMNVRMALRRQQLYVYGLYLQPCVNRNYAQHRNQAPSQRLWRRFKHWRLSYWNYKPRLQWSSPLQQVTFHKFTNELN